MTDAKNNDMTKVVSMTQFEFQLELDKAKSEQKAIDDAERDTAVYNLLILKLDVEKKLWLDKVCEWFKNNLGYYDRHEVHIGTSYEEVVIDAFRKDMEE